MRDIAEQLQRWWDDGAPIGLATVVATRFSAPRPPGASLAVGPDGEIVGSVSAGCVESDVVGALEDVVATGGARLLTYGISDEQAFEVGLACGGEIDVLIERIDRSSAPYLGDVLASVARDQPVALARVVAGIAARGDVTPGAATAGQVGARLAVWEDRTAGTLGAERLDTNVTEATRGMLAKGRTGVRRFGPKGERRGDDLAVFVESFTPRPRMLIFGAIDHAAALCRVGSFLGYRVTVCDARAAFATSDRFPDADEIVVEWPHRYLESIDVDERTVVCVLTHEPKFDLPLLEVALRLPVAYVGVMGSRRTQDARLERLRDTGLTEEQLGRLHAPIGLDLGGRTPEETAISIAAELISTTNSGTGKPLQEVAGPIHPTEVS